MHPVCVIIKTKAVSNSPAFTIKLFVENFFILIKAFLIGVYMIKKADIILLIVILAVGIPLSVLSLSAGTSGDRVRISLNGKVYEHFLRHRRRQS